MFKILGAVLGILCFFSEVQAQNVPSSKYSLTCYANSKKFNGTRSFSADGQAVDRISATLAGNMSFVAYVREKNKHNPITPWIKMGKPEVVINVYYKGYALSDSYGEGNAVSSTRLDGASMNVGCFSKKN